MPFYKPNELPKLMVSPNGSRKMKKDHPEIPMTIPEIETNNDLRKKHFCGGIIEVFFLRLRVLLIYYE